jgi:hypothetical protein
MVATLELVVARFVWRVDTVHERVEIVVVRLVTFVFVVARFHERVETFPERVAMLPVAVARFVWRVAMFPVAVARFVVRVLIFPVAVARPMARLLILTSCTVLLPWSFWRAESTESADVTVPDQATNPVRRDPIARALVK